MNEGLNFFFLMYQGNVITQVRMAHIFSFHSPSDLLECSPTLLLVLRKSFTLPFYRQSIYLIYLPLSTFLHPVFRYLKLYHFNFSLMHI